LCAWLFWRPTTGLFPQIVQVFAIGTPGFCVNGDFNYINNDV
jgi:hypothetical protein